MPLSALLLLLESARVERGLAMGYVLNMWRCVCAANAGQTVSLLLHVTDVFRGRGVGIDGSQWLVQAIRGSVDFAVTFVEDRPVQVSLRWGLAHH